MFVSASDCSEKPPFGCEPKLTWSSLFPSRPLSAALIVFGNNAPEVEKDISESSARAVAVASYLIAELGIFGTFFAYSFHIKAYRAQLRAHCFAWLITSALWIGSIFAEERSAIALAVVAVWLVIDG